MNYAAIDPIQRRIPAARQKAKRHYGVHPYFTRRPYNVVRDYICRYTGQGDVVLDPFGGSGVTAIEAYLENRVGVQNDINPLANFIAQGLVGLVDAGESDLGCAFAMVRERCWEDLRVVERGGGLADLSREVRLPPNVALPRTADVPFYRDLFTDRQLLSLSVLKRAIDSIRDPAVKQFFLLTWSGVLARLNKTFISTNGRAESRGGSSIFSIYRYKVAKRPVELAAWSVFESRYQSLLKARKEIANAIEHKRRTSGVVGAVSLLQP